MVSSPTEHPCAVTTSDGGGGDCKPRSPAGMKLIDLSSEQTVGVRFPIGCPVNYDFRRSGGVVDAREGVVKSIKLDLVSKTLVLDIEPNNAPGSGDGEASTSMDAVFEDDVAYAANCPVTMKPTGDRGEIVFSKSLGGVNDRNEMSYIVRYSSASRKDGYVRFEEGVSPERLQYRPVEVTMSQRTNCLDKSGTQSNPKSVISPCPFGGKDSTNNHSIPREIDDGLNRRAGSRPLNHSDRNTRKKNCNDEQSSLNNVHATMPTGGYHRLSSLPFTESKIKKPTGILKGDSIVSDEDLAGEHGYDRSNSFGSSSYSSFSSSFSTGKRNAGTNESLPKKKFCWEPPPSSFANDGAI